MLHGRIVRPRGQGAYGDGTMPKIVSVDESSIKHIPARRSCGGTTSSASSAPKEYDAIQAAAQLKVKWADPPKLAGQRQPVEVDARLRRSGPGAGADRGSTRATSTPRSPRRREEGVGDVQAPVQRPHADRPDCAVADVTLGRRARAGEHAERRTPCAADRRRCSACRSNKVRVQLLRGLGLVRQRSGASRRRPGGGGHVAARRRAGAAAVHALGRARLGQLRPGASWRTSVPRVDANGQDRRVRVHRLRAGRRSASTRRPSSTATPVGGARASGALDTGNSGPQYNIAEPPRDRQDRCRCSTTTSRRRRMRAPLRSADVLRVGADDRRARVRGEDGPGTRSASRTSAPTDLNRWRGRARCGVAKLANWKPKVAALEPRAGTSSPAAASPRQLRRLAGRRRRRHRGEQEDRQDHGQAHLRRPRTPASRSTPSGLENQMMGSVIQGTSRRCTRRSRSTRSG